MAKVLGIGGVFLKADDPERLIGWYERHLGLRREAGHVAIFPWRHADDPERKGMTVWSLFRRDTDYFGPGGQAGMINYIVDDLDGVLTGLRSAGIEVDDRTEESEYGRFGWAVDPEGNRIELWEPPAGPQ
jgi:predicted enzyme related to lactoylglutathione lyase